MGKLSDIQFFIIFCLEAYKSQYEISGIQAFNIFRKFNVFDYLREGFDLLHTQRIECVVDEINCYIEKNEAISR